MPRATHTQLVSAARTIALEASVNAGRMEAALNAITDAEGYLKSATGSGITGGNISDPTGTTADRELDPTKTTADTASADRALIERIAKRMLDDSADLAKLLTAWAPDERLQARRRGEVGGPAIANDDIWCTNHARHGLTEVRKHGRTLCDFCIEFRGREDNTRSFLPGRWILDVRSRRRLNSADIAKHLADLTAEADAQKAARKAEKSAAKEAEKTTATSDAETAGSDVVSSATDMAGGPVESAP